MEIYLVRHTTPDIEKGICYGQADINLVNSYEDEFKEIHQKLKNINLPIISSPLKRCTLLANSLGAFTTSPLLMELDFGEWELKKWDAISSKEIQPWMDDFVNVKVTNGESYIDLQKRVLNTFTSIKESSIIVSHAGPIRVILAHLSNTELKDSFNIKVNYGDVFKINTQNNSYEKL